MSRFRRVNPPLEPAQGFAGAKVSVIVPARNEEKNIANCLVHLFKQNYKNFEIVVVDDRSTDRTPHLLENFRKLSPVPFRVVRVEKLPAGWTGKNHAMVAGSKAAAGAWLLFTDADTTHGPSSVSTALDCAEKNGIDLLTLAPETECRTFWEKTVQPLAVSSLALWFNTAGVNEKDPKYTLANGQYLLIRKEAYEAVGGNESVRAEVVEDVELVKKMKTAGRTVKFLNGTKLYSTRMYSTLREIKTGWTRIFTYLFNKSVPAITHKIFLFLAFSLLPFALAGLEIYWQASGSPLYGADAAAASFAACVLIIGIRFFGNKLLKCDPRYAVLHPIASLAMLWILFSCLGRVLFNRPSVWRGDSYR